ncbi:aminotransferase class I/II-fold pyridoxal phosphate-dependent enzyme [Melissococcus plutonius]|uniref:pyridoxal phosphate-dependent aminotransferase n=1 Tax=Melissococcus plutonius TaxID=33970 RepID=UPI003EE4B1D7
MNTIQQTKADVFDFINEKLETNDQVINLAIGNPDGKPDSCLIDTLNQYMQKETTHGYGSFDTTMVKLLRKSVADYYNNTFQTSLDADENIVEVPGTKVAIYRLLSLLIKNEEKVLIPSPSYSVYTKCVELLNGEIIYFPCCLDNFSPDLSKVSEEEWQAASILILCSPGNPTTTVLSHEFLEEVIQLAKKYHFLVINDLAYAEINFTSERIPSILAIDGAKDVAVELYSLSKTCNIAGCRIGFVCGNQQLVNQLKHLQFEIDFGLFLPFQHAAITAFNRLPELASKTIHKYEERMDYFIQEMKKVGWEIQKPVASFFIWTKVPSEFEAMTDKEFVSYVLQETGILFSPGSGFGKNGEGYIRIAMVQEMRIMREVVVRLKKLFEDKNF